MGESKRTVYVHFCYDDEMPTPELAEMNEKRNHSLFASLNAAGWPSKGDTRMFWNNTYSEAFGMNVLVAGLGSKDAPEFCEMEMLNEREENARVAAAAAVHALKGFRKAFRKLIYESMQPKLTYDRKFIFQLLVDIIFLIQDLISIVSCSKMFQTARVRCRRVLTLPSGATKSLTVYACRRICSQ